MTADDARKLVARLKDLAVELEKHSNDHIHDEDTADKLGAAVEGVCADRINAILRDYALLAAPPLTYPHPCGLCEGNVESDDDKDWHGLGNCVPTCDRCTGSGIDPKMPPPLGEAPMLTVEEILVTCGFESSEHSGKHELRTDCFDPISVSHLPRVEETDLERAARAEFDAICAKSSEWADQERQIRADEARMWYFYLKGEGCPDWCIERVAFLALAAPPREREEPK